MTFSRTPSGRWTILRGLCRPHGLRGGRRSDTPEWRDVHGLHSPPLRRTCEFAGETARLVKVADFKVGSARTDSTCCVNATRPSSYKAHSPP